jgi:hypothetical protein
MAPIDNLLSSSSAGGLFCFRKSLCSGAIFAKSCHIIMLEKDIFMAICIPDEIR